MRDLKDKRAGQEKLNPFYSAVENLENQLGSYHSIRMGQALRLIPPDKNQNSTTWLPVAEMTDDDKAQFKKIVDAYMAKVKAEVNHDGGAVVAAQSDVDREVDTFVNGIEKRYGDYSERNRINVEVMYNKMHPFRFAWIFYLLGLILLVSRFSAIIRAG